MALWWSSFFFSNSTLEIFQKLNERNGTKYRGVEDFDFQMVRSLRSSTEKKKKKKGRRFEERSGRRRKKKKLGQVSLSKTWLRKKNIAIDALVSFERERERDLFRTTAKLLSKVFFNEQNSIDEPIHRNLCRALIEPNKWKRRRNVHAERVCKAFWKRFATEKSVSTREKKCN